MLSNPNLGHIQIPLDLDGPWRYSIRPHAGSSLPSRHTARRRTISRRSRRCSALFWSITRRFIASRISSSRSISSKPIHQRIFELAGGLDPRRKARDAGHAEDVPAGRSRYRRAHRQSISGAACRRSHDHHQRRGLRPHDLRSVDPPRPDHDRRGHGQPRLRRAGRRDAAKPISRTPSASSSSLPRPAVTKAGFQRFAQALTTAVDMAAHAYQRDGSLSGSGDRA